MIAVLGIFLRLALWLLLAPLLPGIVNKVKAWVAGRRGPPMLQLYYDLAKLWRKGVVMSNLASPGRDVYIPPSCCTSLDWHICSTLMSIRLTALPPEWRNW